MCVTAAHLEKRAEYQVVRGIEVVDLSGPPPIAGSICKIELERHEFRLFLFRDLINGSFHPDYGCFTQTSVNLGASVRDFILGNRYECEGLQSYPAWRPPYLDVHRRCLVASNTLQTNFIRSNGFVIENGRVVAKPRYAPGRDDPGYVELGVAGEYTCLLVSGLGANARARVIHVSVQDAGGEVTDPPLPAGSRGIASPLLVREGRFVDLERHAAPFRDGSGRLRGDWIPWDPEETTTSFTAFGVDESGTVLLMASVFEGEWGVDTAENKGIRAEVMAELLVEHGAHDAILGGGGADTQQFVHGRHPRFRNGPVRAKSPSASRGEVEGIRGLGAIAGIVPRS
jgi:hypothetical protein